MKSKTKLLLILFTVFVVAFALGTGQAAAKKSVKEINKDIKKKSEELKKGKAESADLQKQINVYIVKIKATEKELAALERDTLKTRIDIIKVTKKSKKIASKLDTQSKYLNGRLRSIYKNGNVVGYVDVLLGSESIYDFISNLDMVQRIFENDKEMVAKLQESYDLVKSEKKRLKILNRKLEKQQALEQKTRNKLAVAKTELNEKKSGIDKQNQKIENDIEELQEDRNAILGVIKGDATGSTTVYGGGKFCYPCPGHTNITSGYGPRGFGVGNFHYGVDFGAPYGAKVVAAGSGTVIRAGYQGSYGNVVMISHGSSLYTLYAHNSAIHVSINQKVRKGQHIANVGSTGYSTGPHCHFEVYKGGTGWGVNQVNPMGYLK